MTDTKITGPLSAAEAFLRELCKRHGFSAITLSVHDEGQFDVYIHSGPGNCDMGTGGTLAAALNAANGERLKRLSNTSIVDEENA